MRTITCVAAALLAGAFALAQGDPPAAPKKPDAKKPVYDEKADAKAQIDTALAAAKRENRRVLIQWGANWCDKCLSLDKRFRTDPALRKELLYEYVVVHVDIGIGDRNVDLYQKYKAFSLPTLTVLDASGKVLANEAAGLLATETDGAKKLKEFLTAHQAKALNAEDVLNAALAEAAKTERGVFLHFGAPWCGWCLKLEAWLAQPKIAAIIGKDFVEVKIDNDRMTGGKEVFARYNAKSATSGIPWFVFLDGKGKAVATSDGPKGNIGFPYEAHEITHFMGMLKAARRRITDAEMDELRRSLTPPAKAASAAK